MKYSSMNYMQVFERMLPKLEKGGVFLLTHDEKYNTVNPMTIGWCMCGIVWGKPVCAVLVRQSRYTHELLENCDSFTISAPGDEDMKKQLSVCGSRSGRDMQKLSELGMSVDAVENDGTPLVGCKYHIVCKKVQKSECELSNMFSSEILGRFYASGDSHTMYIGEITDAFESIE